MILQVHDELVFDIPKDEVKIWEEIVRESMENVIKTHSRNQITDNENRI
jgi:DNA polymerase-1